MKNLKIKNLDEKDIQNLKQIKIIELEEMKFQDLKILKVKIETAIDNMESRPPFKRVACSTAISRRVSYFA